jgi:Ca-activated chloride channel family protein
MPGRDLLFNCPQAGFLLLLLLPLLYGQFALSRYRRRQQYTYASPALLSRLLIPRSPMLTYTKIIGWTLIWILICLALMDPLGNIRYSPLGGAPASSISSPTKPHNVPHEIIFLVDTSASMRVPDGTDGETRLEEAKAIMEDVIRQLRGQTVSLYAFTSELSAVVPATVDYLFVRLSIKELHINEGDVGGTRFAPVLTALKQQAFPEPSPKHYTVIMLTDGGDTQLEALKGKAKEQERQAILDAIPNPQQLHLRLLTVGLGSPKPQPIPHVTFEGKPVLSKLEPDILKQLAEHERGEYGMAQEWTTWDLSQKIISQIAENELVEQSDAQGERQVAGIKKEDVLVDLYYQIPLGLALLFYFLNFLLPDVRHL